MWSLLTPELIASAITGLMFALAGIGVYARTKTPPKLDGAYRVESEATAIERQLERIAQALEDLVAANKDSFQRDMRERFEKREEVLEAQKRTRHRPGGQSDR